MVWSKTDKKHYTNERTGLNVRKFNFVSKRLYKDYDGDKKFLRNRMSFDFDDLKIVTEDAFNWLKDLYRFTNGTTRTRIFDPKNGRYIGKISKNPITHKTLYLISLEWLQKELFRTNSPTLAKFLADDAQFFTLLDDWKKELHDKHVKLMQYHHISSEVQFKKKAEDMEVFDEEELCI